MNGMPGRRRDPLDQPHGGLGGDGRVPGRHRHLVRAPAGQRAAQAGRDRHPARLRPSRAGAGVDRPGRDLRVLSGSRRPHSPMELRTLLDWVVAYKLRSVPGVIEVNGMGGEAKQYQVVLDPQAAGRLPPVAAATSTSIARAEQRRDRRRLHREEPASRSSSAATPSSSSRRGHREHGRHLRRRRHAGAAQARWRRCASAPALRFGAVTKHGEGEIVAGTVMMLTGANSREVVHAVKAQAGRDPEGAAGGRRDPLLLRPRRVHRPHAEDRRHQPGRGRGAGRGRPLPHAGQLPRRADRRAGDPAVDGRSRSSAWCGWRSPAT